MGAASAMSPTRRRFFPNPAGVWRRRGRCSCCRRGGAPPKDPKKQGCGGDAVHNNRDQNRMRTVIMKLPAEADFSSEMAAMREWLDKHRCAPSRFKYDLAQEG